MEMCKIITVVKLKASKLGNNETLCKNWDLIRLLIFRHPSAWFDCIFLCVNIPILMPVLACHVLWSHFTDKGYVNYYITFDLIE